MGQNYTENMKLVSDGIADMSKNLDNLITALARQQLEDKEKSRTKAVAKRQQREEERVARTQETTENNKVLADTITTSITTALTTLSTTLSTSISTALSSHLNGNGNNPGETPPPPPPPPPARASVINLKFPYFDREDPDGWIFNTNKYFSVHTTDDALKITIAAASLKGDANVWYRWKQAKVMIVTWAEFSSHVRARFAPTKFVDARLAISTINQNGSVREHIPEFERLLNFVDFPEDYLISCFIRSLKPHIGCMVKLLAPQSLAEAFTKAIHQEEAYAATRFIPRQPYRPPHIRTDAIILTFLDIDEEDTDIPAEKSEETISFDHAEVSESEPKMSFTSLMGSSFPRTMRIMGYMKGQPLTFLIESGSTHNFLHPNLARQCGYIPQVNDTALCVTVGDGGQMQTKGSCHSIPFTLHGYSFSADFHLLDISGCDAVLGVHWLRTLGPITWNFSKLTMYFQNQDKEITSVISSTPSVCHPPEIQQLLHEFYDIFETPTSLPPERIHDHRIPLVSGSTPVNVKPYRYPYFQKSEIEKIVVELQLAGFICLSSSSYSSTVLMVRKKDGSWRMCVDYRALNKLTIKDRFPIPVVDELLDELHDATVFSKLGLRSGYHQIRLHKSDIPKTAFRTHDGYYEFLVMPFGLSNAPATFQILMNHIFRQHLRKFVLVVFDDILIYSKNMSDHLVHLSFVFEILRSNQLFVKESKCQFAQSSVGYLGHVISEKGVSVENDKIECIVSWPISSTIRELRGFLGLEGYYRKFVKDFGKISAPLTKMLKKDAFEWTDQANGAFKLLQRALNTTPVLILLDFSKEFSIECDASGFGLGAVLLQSGRPIAYHSKPLAEKNRNISVYDKEMLAIISAIQKWRRYLLGRHFKIYTDHMSLNLSAPIFGGVTEIVQECHTDIEYKELIQKLIADPTYKPKFSYVEGVLRYKGRIVVVSTSSWCTKILEEFHTQPICGQSGFLRTYKRMQHSFYWKGLKQFVKTFVLHCDVCQRSKSEVVSPPGLLGTLPIPTDVWIDISMDFIDGFPSSNRKNSILVVVDRLSKYAHFIPLTHPYSASSVAEIFVREVVRLHGMPRTIVSDRDPIFMRNFWEHTLHFRTQNYVAVQRTILSPMGKQSRPPSSITTYLPGSTSVHDVDLNLKARDHTLKLLKSHLHDAQSRMKKSADSHLAYKLNLPTTSRIHPVFHVSQLKLKLEMTTSVEQILPAIIDYDKWEHDTILDIMMYNSNRARTKWLIKWKNHAQDEATWEDAADFLVRFPKFEA
ncbi:uncharacterized protein LOC113352960 [Papaver somniferum]|uniref:uncharacterized protein LOC113352960 n=1 Tax=Papaver somniferum TaxID=3469 RepID=UPI000E6FE1B2|nr:uncharacterized protein LOC113352960 [Papaver somniferum]